MMQLPFALLNLIQDATNEDYLMNSVLLIGLIDLLSINSLIESIDFDINLSSLLYNLIGI